MRVDLEAINQKMLLGDSRNGISFTATLRLPGGDTIDVQMTAQDAERIIADHMAPAEKLGAEEPEMITWEDLPDDVIPPAIKQVMRDLQVSEQMSVSALEELVEDISSRMSEAHNEVPADSFVDPDEAEAKPAPAGRLQRAPEHVSAERVRAVPARRTVQMNSAGYPVVPEMYRADPGEIGPGADEDGISQL
jgi:hypothetical protein